MEHNGHITEQGRLVTLRDAQLGRGDVTANRNNLVQVVGPLLADGVEQLGNNIMIPVSLKFSRLFCFHSPACLGDH